MVKKNDILLNNTHIKYYVVLIFGMWLLYKRNKTLWGMLPKVNLCYTTLSWIVFFYKCTTFFIPYFFQFITLSYVASSSWGYGTQVACLTSRLHL